MSYTHLFNYFFSFVNFQDVGGNVSGGSVAAAAMENVVETIENSENAVEEVSTENGNCLMLFRLLQ